MDQINQIISEPSSKTVTNNIVPHLPTECFRCIFSFVEDDLQTLHSISLVNRTWCKNIIPILWKRPFTLPQGTESSSLWKIISIYLSYWPEDFLAIPEMQNIKQSIYQRSTVFDYASFLRELNYKRLYD